MRFKRAPGLTLDYSNQLFATPATRGPRSLRAVGCMAVLMSLGLMLSWPQPAWAVNTVLERPTFDRDRTALVFAYRGALPRVTTESFDGGTRWVANFSNAEARSGVAYQMGLFHPLVTKIDVLPDNGADKIRVVILLSRPSQLAIQPDARTGTLRLALIEGEADAYAREGMDTLNPQSDPAPQSKPPTRAANAAPPSMSTALPSQIQQNRPVPGSPASGQYVYRKIIPGADPKDVTEVEIRSPRRKNLDIQDDPNRKGVNVNVSPQDASPDGEFGYQTGGAPGFALPGGPARPDVSYRPLSALQAHLGYATTIAERAPALGLEYTGGGSALLAASAQMPLNNQINALIGLEGFNYTVRYAQLPDAVLSQRTEIWGQARLEYLAIRKPWVLAVGAEYWLRYIRGNHNALAPVLPSLAFASNAFWQGPALQMRVFYPFWNNLALTVDGAIAPGLFGGGDPSVQLLGNLWGYRAGAGIKWSTRHVALQLGYRHQGLSTYDTAYSASRGGPEVSALWRF